MRQGSIRRPLDVVADPPFHEEGLRAADVGVGVDAFLHGVVHHAARGDGLCCLEVKRWVRVGGGGLGGGIGKGRGGQEEGREEAEEEKGRSVRLVRVPVRARPAAMTDWALGMCIFAAGC